MPGHAGSPYWAAVDFDSEGDEEQTPTSNHRVYLDPWDNEAVGMIHGETPELSQEENMNSFAGEPVSASFYYVPTKNYDSGEEISPVHKRNIPQHDVIAPEYAAYNRKMSRTIKPDYSDMALYGHAPIQERRRSMYVEDPIYGPRPMAYEPIYAPVPLPPPGYLPSPRSRMSLAHHPEYMMANLGYGKYRRHSRLPETYEPFIYESVSPEYEDWARPLPKTAPNNFHLSRYGHLQIDYSCSWNSLDRLIRNQ